MARRGYVQLAQKVRAHPEAIERATEEAIAIDDLPTIHGVIGFIDKPHVARKSQSHDVTVKKTLAAKAYAKKIGLGKEIQDDIAEIVIEAEARAGELLKESAETGERETRGGNRKSNSHDVSLKKTLADMGIEYMQSSRWQKVSAIPESQKNTGRMMGPALPTLNSARSFIGFSRSGIFAKTSSSSATVLCANPTASAISS
jgi:hypothetical protein